MRPNLSDPYHIGAWPQRGSTIPGLPLAPNTEFTENTAAWVGVSEAPSTLKICAADPVSGRVGFFGVIKEFGKPGLYRCCTDVGISCPFG
jgi:hypothetical protein